MKGSTGIEATERKLRALIAGMKKKLDLERVVPVRGEEITLGEFVVRAETRYDRYKSVHVAERLVAMRIKLRDREHRDDRDFLGLARNLIGSLIGHTNRELEEFGMKPKRPARPLTVAEKKRKVERARETRAKNQSRKKKD
jgi:hypothetical protein